MLLAVSAVASRACTSLPVTTASARADKDADVNDFGPARESELDELTSMLAWSFGFPKVDAEPWLRRGGIENVRVVRRALEADVSIGAYEEEPAVAWTVALREGF